MRAVLLFVAMCVSVMGIAQTDSTRILKDIRRLADDKYSGRGAGTSGEQKAADYIASRFKKLRLTPKGDDRSYLQKFAFKKGAHGEGDEVQSANVVAFLDNQAPTTVVIGAHYDHLGTDGQGSSLDPNPANKIHNGADDNASGVAGVLELARYFSTNTKTEKNNFLFICFAGEELGLLGSKHFVEHPSIDLSSVTYMINMDMVGRLDRSTKSLMINGTGTSPVWEQLLRSLSTNALTIKTDSSGVGPSDHTSFYLKDVPVLHFFTGSHTDYHKPSDDWEKINAGGEAEVLNLIVRIVTSLEAEPRLTFLKTKTRATASRTSFKVTLGIMPSYAGGDDGLKVDGVTEGRPASHAGIQPGDVIVELGSLSINNIDDYMEALGKFEKGQTVPVRVKRAGEILTLSVTF